MKKKLKDITIGEAEAMCRGNESHGLYNCTNCPFYKRPSFSNAVLECSYHYPDDFDLNIEIDLEEKQ